jgi:hypothetical protein
MFYKGTAMEFQRRSDGLAALNSHDFSADGEDICITGAISSDQLKRACQALPELDAIVPPFPDQRRSFFELGSASRAGI